jgi:hypothetical protein
LATLRENWLSFNLRFSAREVIMDMVAYWGYFIELCGEASTWRFLASPTHADLPIFSRAVSHHFPSREAALVHARKHIDHLLTG